jgi:hypothetical protein
MENVKQKVVKILEQKCGLPYDVSVYMNHVVIKIPSNDGTDFYHTCQKVQAEVMNCINRNFSSRADDILFCIKKDGHEHIFKVYKHVS